MVTVYVVLCSPIVLTIKQNHGKIQCVINPAVIDCWSSHNFTAYDADLKQVFYSYKRFQKHAKINDVERIYVFTVWCFPAWWEPN